MARVGFIDHGGKRILHIDLSHSPAEEVLQTIAEAQRIIAAQPPASLLTLTDVTGTRFDDAITAALRSSTSHNAPFVRAAAVVGVTGLKTIVLNSLQWVTKREFSTFDDFELAREWLASR